jgi:hypothetical protein
MKKLWTYEKVIRITDEQTGGDKFVTFNQNGTNVIAQGRYDIVVSDHPETETTRNWISRMLMDFATRMSPEIALPVLETALEMSDVPNKEKVIAKIKQAQEKADILAQQRIMNEAMGKQKPPPAGVTAEGQPPVQA